MKDPTYVGELNNANLSEVSETIVRGIFVHNDGDVLHRLRTKPFRHFPVFSLEGCLVDELFW